MGTNCRLRCATRSTTAIVDLSDRVTVFIPACRQLDTLFRFDNKDLLEENARSRGTIVWFQAESSKHTESVGWKIEGSANCCGPVAVLKDRHVGYFGSLENGEGSEGPSDPITENEHGLNTSVRHRSGRVLQVSWVGGWLKGVLFG